MQNDVFITPFYSGLTIAACIFPGLLHYVRNDGVSWPTASSRAKRGDPENVYSEPRSIGHGGHLAINMSFYTGLAIYTCAASLLNSFV